MSPKGKPNVPLPPAVDHVWGIDRYEHSQRRGELVVKIILLWHKPGCKIAKDNLTGALAHGTEVFLHDPRPKIRDDRKYYYVEGRTDGGPIQSGWTTATLLKKLGVDEPGIKELEDGELKFEPEPEPTPA